MTIQTQTMTRDQVVQRVVELAMRLPVEQLASWYQYGLFIQSQAAWVPVIEKKTPVEEIDLADEFAMWEAASDEDWQKIEAMIEEPN